METTNFVSFLSTQEEIILKQQKKIDDIDSVLENKIQYLCQLEAVRRITLLLIDKTQNSINKKLKDTNNEYEIKTNNEDIPFFIDNEKKNIKNLDFSFIKKILSKIDPNKLSLYPFGTNRIPKSILLKRSAMVSITKVESAFTSVKLLLNDSTSSKELLLRNPSSSSVIHIQPELIPQSRFRIIPIGYVSTIFTRRNDAPRQPFLGHTGGGELIFPKGLPHKEIEKIQPKNLLWVVFGLY